MKAMISRMALLGSFGLGFVLGLGACAPARPVSPRQSPRQEGPPVASVPAPAPISPRVDFQTQVRPVLENRCQPCHFAGGKMYERLPFDRPETIRALGERLFTRIKDEQEQALLRSFFAQGPEPRSR